MSAALNYPYLLAVHEICRDGQLHQQELLLLQSLAVNVGVDAATGAAAELILAQDDQHLSLNAVLQAIKPEQYTLALLMTKLASLFDGVFDRTEQQLLGKLRLRWKITNAHYAHIEALALQEARRLIASLEPVSFAWEQMSGPEYDQAIEDCRKVGLQDIQVADTCLHATAQALQDIAAELDCKISNIQTHLGDKPAESGREALCSMESDRDKIKSLINQELRKFQELQIKKRNAMSLYTIAFMGRSKAGKSTLHAVVTGGGWDQIGVGRQNTTRLNRIYEWHNIRIVDTPGIATPGGEDLEKMAESIIDEADLICFVVTNNNQQASEFEFLKQLRDKGKPLLVLLNVKEDLNHPVRLKRFLAQPDLAFSEEKDRLGGHIDRIRRDAAEYYGTAHFPIIPVHLLAAQIAQQQPDHEHAKALMKASRLQNFFDTVRLSLLDEGLLRRSQNLLGSTVADIERPCQMLDKRADCYLEFAESIRSRSHKSVADLQKSVNKQACKLENDLHAVFAALQREVPDFAEDHWDDSESCLNDAWKEQLQRYGKKIQSAQELAVETFSADLKDLLDEVNQEISLHRKFSFVAGKLDEQDSSVWFQKTLQWGSGFASLGIGVLALANLWNPGGWVIAGVALVGAIASLFESKASKRRKAVSKISSALESQIEKQQKKVVDAALVHFHEQCRASAAVLQDYYRVSADGLAFVGEALRRGAGLLQAQRDILNIHFAARILDFAGKAPSESSAQALRQQISGVRRKVGERIDIVVSPELRAPKNLSTIEPIIQEEITLLRGGI